MRTRIKTRLTQSILSALLVLGCREFARGEPPVSTSEEKTLKGILSAVDQKEKTVQVKSFLKTRTANVADDCKVSLTGNPEASPADLRVGQQVEIRYENTQGVPIASRITQEPMIWDGNVVTIDPAKHIVMVRHHMLDKTFQIADDCRVVLPDDKTGALGDVQPGHHVLLVYEIPNGQPTVHQIAETGKRFTGTLTAIDLNERTLKAGSKKFILGNECKIIIEGKPKGQLRDLRIGDELVFNYEDIKGVLVANRIGRDSASVAPENASTSNNRDPHWVMNPQ